MSALEAALPLGREPRSELMRERQGASFAVSDIASLTQSARASTCMIAVRQQRQTVPSALTGPGKNEARVRATEASPRHFNGACVRVALTWPLKESRNTACKQSSCSCMGNRWWSEAYWVGDRRGAWLHSLLLH